MSGGKILFIDAYDSFSNNIITLLRQELGVATETIKIDDPRFVLNDDAFHEHLQHFDAVVAGPGPGHPEIDQDVGLIAKIWRLPKSVCLPILGICLGFQSLCVSEGARIERLELPRHGIVTKITHRSSGIFAGVQDVLATQYHSLHAVLRDHGVDQGDDGCSLWKESSECSNLIPLAWDLSDDENGPILMAVQHKHKPFAGVQFHPESICTNHAGKRIVRNWWQQVYDWKLTNTKQLQISEHNTGEHTSRQQLPSSFATSFDHVIMDMPSDFVLDDFVELFKNQCRPFEPLVLQSGTRCGRPLNPETGRYSIVGVHDEQSLHIRYTCSDSILSLASGEMTILSRRLGIAAAFDFLKSFVDERRVLKGPSIPFWGGLIGYASYEAGLASIEVSPSESQASQPDLWFVFVERSIVVDHIEGTIFVQSTRSNDRSWIDEAARMIKENVRRRTSPETPVDTTVLSEPQQEQYCAKVEKCQEHLRAGSSYELCLTDQTRLRSSEDPWQIYRRLNRSNPAPFGAYIKLEDNKDTNTGITVVGSSPERFLSWSRNGKCQFRPIKGTVPRSNGTTRAEAETILRSQKEMAENLMIVDLIRHDLAGVEGVHNVRVPSLMAVEEYETVYQLVSVIEGDLAPSASGVSVLAASLPPGSMTGAPKRRSCELLQEIEEHQPRGLYSGVIGYIDVGGAGDFSVEIRTAFKWSNEQEWRIGAGGAVTILSTPEGEHEEMLVKRERLINVFASAG